MACVGSLVCQFLVFHVDLNAEQLRYYLAWHTRQADYLTLVSNVFHVIFPVWSTSSRLAIGKL